MKRNSKVSIIIGCYNVSKWLKEKKLSCILNQTYKDIEILLVNDGSTDGTLSVCNYLKENDDRIFVISKDNGGLGSARNAGLDYATGDFVWFYDVDDEVELDLIEKNVFWMNNYHADLVIFGMWFKYMNGFTDKLSFSEKLLESNQSFKDIFLDSVFLVPNGNGYVTNKFYRRSILEEHHFRFGNQRIQQDELFNVHIYPIINRVYISSEVLYHYYIYNTGNTRSRFIPNRYDIYLSIYNGLKVFSVKWNLNDKRLNNYIINRLFAGINSSILFNTFHKDAPYSLKEKKKIILEILNKKETVECLNGIDIRKKTVEEKLYYKAYKKKSFILIYVLHSLFSELRRIKQFIIKS